MGDRNLGGGAYVHIRDHEGDEPRGWKGPVEEHVFWPKRHASPNPPARRRMKHQTGTQPDSRGRPLLLAENRLFTYNVQRESAVSWRIVGKSPRKPYGVLRNLSFSEAIV